jgi:hypothetical protein
MITYAETIEVVAALVELLHVIPVDDLNTITQQEHKIMLDGLEACLKTAG